MTGESVEAELVPWPGDRPQGFAFRSGISAELPASGRRLAAQLRALTRRLDCSMTQYAATVCRDKATLTRYFNGTEIPPADFVDRLIEEGDRVCGRALTAEARAAVRELHRTAQREATPKAAVIQALRDEVNEARALTDQANAAVGVFERELAAARRLIAQQAVELQRLQQEQAVTATVLDLALRQGAEEQGALRDRVAQLEQLLERAEHRATELAADYELKVRELERAEDAAEAERARARTSEAERQAAADRAVADARAQEQAQRLIAEQVLRELAELRRQLADGDGDDAESATGAELAVPLPRPLDPAGRGRGEPLGPVLRSYTPTGPLRQVGAQVASVVFYRNGGYSVVTALGSRHYGKGMMAKAVTVVEVAQGTHVRQFALRLPSATWQVPFPVTVELHWAVVDHLIVVREQVTDVVTPLRAVIEERLGETTRTFAPDAAAEASRAVDELCGLPWNELGLRLRLFVWFASLAPGPLDKELRRREARSPFQQEVAAERRRVEEVQARAGDFRLMADRGSWSEIARRLGHRPRELPGLLELLHQEAGSGRWEVVDRVRELAEGGELPEAAARQIRDLPYRRP